MVSQIPIIGIFNLFASLTAILSLHTIVSDYEAGTVIDQSISSSESVAEHTKVYLTVSSGPQG